MKFRTTLTAALAAGALLVAGCGDDDGDAVRTTGGSADIAALRAAPDAFEEAGSGRMSYQMRVSGDGMSIEMGGEGAFSGDRMIMEIDLGSMGQALGPGAGDLTATVIVDGGTTYMKMPALADVYGDGWLSFSAEDFAEVSDLGVDPAAQDPRYMMESLRGIAEEIEEEGTDTVRGVDTTVYRVVVDLEKAAEAMPEDMRESYLAEMESLGIPSSMPMRVWLGDDGLVYRFSMDMTEMEGFTDGTDVPDDLEAEMVMEFFDYGADVDIEVPDPAEVTPFVEVMGGAYGG